jgi:hypothetical protein
MLARGTRVSQVVLTTCNVAFAVLHILLGRGTIEFHFGVFLLLGLTLVQRDRRPVLLTAGLPEAVRASPCRPRRPRAGKCIRSCRQSEA